MAMITFTSVFILIIGILPSDSLEQCVSKKPEVHLDGGANKEVSYVSSEYITGWLPNSSAGHIVGGFFYSNGFITVPESGTYYVYCQIYFHHASPEKPRFSAEANGKQIFLGQSQAHQGATTIHSGGIFKLSKGDNLSVRIWSQSSTVRIKIQLGNGHSFFGAYMI